jgi:hypothetical protein
MARPETQSASTQQAAALEVNSNQAKGWRAKRGSPMNAINIIAHYKYFGMLQFW